MNQKDWDEELLAIARWLDDGGPDLPDTQEETSKADEVTKTKPPAASES